MNEQDYLDQVETEMLQKLVNAINTHGFVDAIVDHGYTGTNAMLAASINSLRTALLRFGHLWDETLTEHGIAGPA